MSRDQSGDDTDHPATHTVTTPVTDALRHALALPAGVDPASVRVVDAAVDEGELTIEIAGAEL